MKVMAIGTLAADALEQLHVHMPKEVPQTLQLYLDGKMEQFWERTDGNGVVFLMNVESVAEADKLLTTLPLGHARLLNFELIPVGPLTPLGMLIT